MMVITNKPTMRNPIAVSKVPANRYFKFASRFGDDMQRIFSKDGTLFRKVDCSRFGDDMQRIFKSEVLLLDCTSGQLCCANNPLAEVYLYNVDEALTITSVDSTHLG